MRISGRTLVVTCIYLGLPAICGAQAGAPDQQQSTGQAPAPVAMGILPAPAVTGPLQSLPPAVFDAGPLGKIAVNGVLDGLGVWTGNYIPGDNSTQGAVSNGQVFIQKTSGWFQFYLQAGAYNLAALGSPFLATDKTVSNLYGPLPVAYLKLQAGKSTSVLVGQMPTLIGAEYTFTFENMNVGRGLLWNQENAINRGIQVNRTLGKLSASLSWNDGFYSNRYTWLTGSLTYADGPNSLAFVAGGNAGKTAFRTYATPAQNNSSIYEVIYTYNKPPWIFQPYWQHTRVAANPNIGIPRGNSTHGGALLVSRSLRGGFSLPARFEYITSTGKAAEDAVNLMYGPGSAGASATLTPTFQRGGLFVRADLSWVHLMNVTPGAAFGRSGMGRNQPRAIAEIGFIFGNNLVERKAP